MCEELQIEKDLCKQTNSLTMTHKKGSLLNIQPWLKSAKKNKLNST